MTFSISSIAALRFLWRKTRHQEWVLSNTLEPLGAELARGRQWLWKCPWCWWAEGADLLTRSGDWNVLISLSIFLSLFFFEQTLQPRPWSGGGLTWTLWTWTLWTWTTSVSISEVVLLPKASKTLLQRSTYYSKFINWSWETVSFSGPPR